MKRASDSKVADLKQKYLISSLINSGSRSEASASRKKCGVSLSGLIIVS